MKTIHCLLYRLLCAVTIPLTTSAQQTVNPYDWFTLGQTTQALSSLDYYRSLGAWLQDD